MSDEVDPTPQMVTSDNRVVLEAPEPVEPDESGVVPATFYGNPELKTMMGGRLAGTHKDMPEPPEPEVVEPEPQPQGVQVLEIIGNPEAEKWLKGYEKQYEEDRK